MRAEIKRVKPERTLALAFVSLAFISYGIIALISDSLTAASVAFLGGFLITAVVASAAEKTGRVGLSEKARKWNPSLRIAPVKLLILAALSVSTSFGALWLILHVVSVGAELSIDLGDVSVGFAGGSLLIYGIILIRSDPDTPR
jgi:hypothetical protein